MFSEILHELDRNTTHYMVDDMKEKIKKHGQTIAEQQEALASKNRTITEQQKTISEQKAALEANEAEIKHLREKLAALNRG